jgi:inner membrane protein
VHANLPAEPASAAAFAAGAVAPDVDHVPLIPVRHKIGKDDPRPAAHTLLTPAGVAVAGFFLRPRAQEFLAGLVAGVWVHFVRDVATGAGLAPLQPLTRWRVNLPTRAYEAAMALLVWRALTLER